MLQPGFRGRLGSLQQLAIVTGIFVSLLVDFLFARSAGGSGQPFWLGLEAWQWMFLAMAVPAIVYGALSLTIPESRRFLISKHKIAAATAILSKLLGETNIELKIARIRETMERATEPSWHDLTGPSGRIAGIVWAGLLLSVFQQFVGINVIFYYSNILTTLIAIASVDRFGRKPLLIIGSIGMTITLGTMAVVFGTATVVVGSPVLSGVQGPIALVAANLFSLSLSACHGDP